jgi:hypothetical protein
MLHPSKRILTNSLSYVGEKGRAGRGQRVFSSTHPEICSIDQATHPPSIYSQYTIFHISPKII